jgi:hypothetical protein
VAHVSNLHVHGCVSFQLALLIFFQLFCRLIEIVGELVPTVIMVQVGNLHYSGVLPSLTWPDLRKPNSQYSVYHFSEKLVPHLCLQDTIQQPLTSARTDILPGNQNVNSIQRGELVSEDKVESEAIGIDIVGAGNRDLEGSAELVILVEFIARAERHGQ